MKEITINNLHDGMKEVRERSSFSIKEFSEVIGTSPSTISRVEHGENSPSYNLMNKLKALVVIGRAGFDIYLDFDVNFVDSMTAGVAFLKSKGDLKIPEYIRNYVGIGLAKEIKNICEHNNTILV